MVIAGLLSIIYMKATMAAQQQKACNYDAPNQTHFEDYFIAFHLAVLRKLPLRKRKATNFMSAQKKGVLSDQWYFVDNLLLHTNILLI